MTAELPPLTVSLEGVNRYNPGNIPALQDHVDLQCKTGGYDLNANLALLKLYQFLPSSANDEVVSKILLKALTRFPDSDFGLCLALLNESILEKEPIKKILSLSQALETADFPVLWAEIEASSSLIAPISGFSDSIRKCISIIVSITFQAISLDILRKYLHLEDPALAQFVGNLSWTIEGSIVKIPLNSENQARPSFQQENIKFESLTKLIGHSSQ